MKAGADAGWFVDGSTYGMYTHELTHGAHFYASPLTYRAARFFPSEDAQMRIARRVSRYATANPHEFVAEVGSGLLSGRHYDPEVMALYEHFGGPPLR
jgi:hypothetical protein